MNGLISKIALGWVRHLVTVAAGALVANGYLTGAEGEQATGALMIIVPLLFSAYDKWHVIQAKDAALLAAAKSEAVK